MQNGKGDAPRNCFSKQYKDHFDDIFRKPGAKPVDISKWQKKRPKDEIDFLPKPLEMITPTESFYRIVNAIETFNIGLASGSSSADSSNS